MTIDDMIAVLQAAKNHKKLQYLENGIWCDHPSYPLFGDEWRIRPEPREGWVHQADICLRPGNFKGQWLRVREVLE